MIAPSHLGHDLCLFVDLVIIIRLAMGDVFQSIPDLDLRIHLVQFRVLQGQSHR